MRRRRCSRSSSLRRLSVSTCRSSSSSAPALSKRVSIALRNSAAALTSTIPARRYPLAVGGADDCKKEDRRKRREREDEDAQHGDELWRSVWLQPPASPPRGRIVTGGARRPGRPRSPAGLSATLPPGA